MKTVLLDCFQNCSKSTVHSKFCFFILKCFQCGGAISSEFMESITSLGTFFQIFLNFTKIWSNFLSFLGVEFLPYVSLILAYFDPVQKDIYPFSKDNVAIMTQVKNVSQKFLRKNSFRLIPIFTFLGLFKNSCSETFF